MAFVLLGLGSNQNAAKTFISAIKCLKAYFGDVVLSPVYESEAVGFKGDNFLNMVIEVQTELSVGDLLALLKKIEDTHGRDRSMPKFSGRTLDIDILVYDNIVGVIDGVPLPRDEILDNAFVLKPLSDTWPELLHPERKEPYCVLWQKYDKSKQRLWPFELSCTDE